MSAQPSLLISTRLLSSQLLDSLFEATGSTEGKPQAESLLLLPSDSLLLSEPLTDLEGTLEVGAAQEISARATQAKQALKQIENKLEQEDNQPIVSIEALENNILEDSNFDFSLLPSTAAGNEKDFTGNDTEIFAAPGETFASNAYVEPSLTSSTSQAGQALNQIKVQALNTPNKNPQQSTALDSEELNHSNRSLGTSHQSATEDLRIKVTGQIDTPYELENSSLQTEYGQIDLSHDGSWLYTLNNDTQQIQSLGANDALSESLNLLSKSGDSFTLNITIHGVNDGAKISGDKNGEVSTLSNHEAGERPETISGKLSVNDKDQNEAQMLAEEAIEGTYGQLNISSNGEWSYTLNSESEAVKSLHQEDSLHDLIPVKSIDGTNQLLKITIHGADDSPLLSGDNSETISLANATHAEQKLNIDDPDFGQSHFLADKDIATRSNYGTASIDKHGNWRYEINTDSPKVLSLGDNEHLFDTFVVHSVDGTPQTVIVKIEGSEQPLFARTGDESHNTLIDSGLIENNEHLEAQQTLDSFLAHSASKQLAGTPIMEQIDVGSASEIMQQLSQHNSHNNDMIS